MYIITNKNDLDKVIIHGLTDDKPVSYLLVENKPMGHAQMLVAIYATPCQMNVTNLQPVPVAVFKSHLIEQNISYRALTIEQADCKKLAIWSTRIKTEKRNLLATTKAYDSSMLPGNESSARIRRLIARTFLAIRAFQSAA